MTDGTMEKLQSTAEKKMERSHDKKRSGIGESVCVCVFMYFSPYLE